MPTTTTAPKKGGNAKKAAPAQEAPTGGIQLLGDGKYPKARLSDITIVPRPKEGEKKLFFNPRSATQFTPEKLAPLIYSIRLDELSTPPLVRAITDEKRNITRLELIAGERRKRSLDCITLEDLPVFDENAEKPEVFAEGSVIVCRGRFGTVVAHAKGCPVTVAFADQYGTAQQEIPYDDVYPTISGYTKYEWVEVRVIYDCDDKRAMRLSFTENDQSEPLTIQEEIALVERLLGKVGDEEGLTLAEVAEMLNQNITWVSQTGAFRDQLPPDAFDKLLTYQMTRNVAVNILSYKPEDRKAYYDAMVADEQETTAKEVATHRKKAAEHEDAEEIHRDNAQRASEDGDDKQADAERRKAETAAKKAEVERQRLQRARDNAGHLTSGHAKRAGAKTGLTPRKPKMLDRDEIESIFAKGMTRYIANDVTDPVTGNKFPTDLACMIRRAALAIINGERDPEAVMRDYLVANGIWDVPATTQSQKEEDEMRAVKQTPTRRKPAIPVSTLPSHVLRDDPIEPAEADPVGDELEDTGEYGEKPDPTEAE